MKISTFLFVTLPLLAQQGIRVGTFPAESRTFHLLSQDVRSVTINSSGKVLAVSATGTVTLDNQKWIPAAQSASRNEPQPDSALTGNVRQRATASDGRIAIAAANGLFLKQTGGAWQALTPGDGQRSWAPRDVRGVAFDTAGRLWFASPQGAGCLDKSWKLYTGHEGLPYDDFTTMEAGEPGVVWFGTKKGAIRFDGNTWEYRQGQRWLPDDNVRSIAVAANGDAWIATAKGLAVIERKPITLAAKARAFEEAIDKRHRRTPYEYVLEVSLKRAGDTNEWAQHDSDNDGLWTSMYGAGECFAYGATKDPNAKKRAKAAFEALRFLGEVTQGGTHPAPKGFVARSILPTSGRNPNLSDSKERDENKRLGDASWKVLVPRWPISADGKWYWKTDTSSDELDGHYFFYALYYDLVADTEQEKERVRAVVAGITDHLLDHNYKQVDHDGKPTRWSIFDPANLNHNRAWWQERGMNSLSILAYLKVAEHVTGNVRYSKAARELVDRHAYGMNALIPKSGTGPGGGNQSDDEMIFMNYYSLIRYEKYQDLREKYALALHNHWLMEEPELNPLFNFIYAALCTGQEIQDPFGKIDLSPRGRWLEEAVDTLKRFPLDRLDWQLTNSHRKDIVPLPAYTRERDGRKLGYRRDGRVLPIDERNVQHWNHDPWQLDYAGRGTRLADGAAFLLPYYMGLYHKYILE